MVFFDVPYDFHIQLQVSGIQRQEGVEAGLAGAHVVQGGFISLPSVVVEYRFKSVHILNRHVFCQLKDNIGCADTIFIQIFVCKSAPELIVVDDIGGDNEK